MLQQFLDTLCAELSLSPSPKADKKGRFMFPVQDNLSVALSDLDPGVAMHSVISLCPKKRQEDLFIYLMHANLLGQGTGGSRIGLDPEEKSLTLSFGLPYEIKYQNFKETFEIFVNHIIYWRSEIRKFEQDEYMY
ncbi:MAG: type III secretion system chaperone [Chlamydiia bacterium]|nr:type III secretion system chaperone [Chlamydiia bacterium]